MFVILSCPQHFINISIEEKLFLTLIYLAF